MASICVNDIQLESETSGPLPLVFCVDTHCPRHIQVALINLGRVGLLAWQREDKAGMRALRVQMKTTVMALDDSAGNAEA